MAQTNVYYKKVSFITLLIITFTYFPLSAKIPFFYKIFDKKIKSTNLDFYENKLGYRNNDFVYLRANYHNKNTELYDMEGNVLQVWNTVYKRAILLKNCNLLSIAETADDFITEKNFNGDIQWSYEAPGKTHHDIEIDNNGKMIFLYHTTIPENFSIHKNCRANDVLTDVVLEIDKSSNKLFEWYAHENFSDVLRNIDCESDETKTKIPRNRFSPHLDWTHMNSINIITENQWYEKGFKEFKPGNIIITSRQLSEVFIIDRDTKKIVWSYKGDKLGLEHPHEAKMIQKGLPGEGHLLIFDNGDTRKYSRILEIDPVSKKIIWSYQKKGEFYSEFCGSHQRLDDGSTFISEDGNHRSFIVSKDKKILWQFKHLKNQGLGYSKRSKLYPKKEFSHCFSK